MMTRHVLIGRLGSTDRGRVAANSTATKINVDLSDNAGHLVGGMGEALDTLSGLGIKPTEIAIDLLVLAALVYAADTRVNRGMSSQDSWSREFDLIVPVSNPNVWIEHTKLLERTLAFLTGDIWSIDFRRRPTRFRTLSPVVNAALKLERSHDCVCLFSGGLDSFVGVLNLLREGRRPLLVSHAGDGTTSFIQKKCLRNIKNKYPTHRLDQIRVWLNFPINLVSEGEKEDSTRSRSFLFFSLACLAVSGLSDNAETFVPENGLISLNVPLDPLRLGSLTTRTTHPFYMARWNELLSKLGFSTRVTNPYQFKTKGELLRECLDQATLKKLLPLTMSCSAPTKYRWRGEESKHCGHCVPCVIRRAAITTAYRSDPTAYYVGDLTAAPVSSTETSGHDIRAFQYTIDRARRNPALIRSLIFQTGPLSDVSGHIDDLADLYRRGLDELHKVLRRVVTQP